MRGELDFKESFRQPHTSTLHSTPSTLNPQPSTLNTQHSTLNPTLYTLNPQDKMVCVQVAEITESAMRGELDFKESFRQRMKLLKGLDRSVLQVIYF
jgi:phosphoserine phosphatase